ncbi:MAG TPA: phospholipase [Gammaproteobacteria bacterium]|nr:phospholipase [Gammaproteobacteria bacterium]
MPNPRSIALGLLMLLAPALAVSATDSARADCLRQQFEQASDETTIGQIRARCRQAARPLKSRIDRRIDAEKRVAHSRFGLLPHRTNYVLAAAYNSSFQNNADFQDFLGDEDVGFQHVEAKFQLSIKMPLAYDLFGTRSGLYLGYTNRSFWQAYNTRQSSPFRETNHEPELWLSFYNTWKILGFQNTVNSIGLSHQSNGRAGVLSRSWNRVYARFIFEKDNLAFEFKPWWRIPESTDNDDNPDIDDYLGYFELGGVYKDGDNTFSLRVRNNLRSSENRGSLQLDWSFPLTRYLRGYVQWFNGYGESLIDYNHNVNSFGIGIQMTDWL